MQAFYPDDPVTNHLKRQGFTPEVAYFEGSGFVMGRSVRFEDFTWVYRFEEGTLTVCDFAAVQNAQGQGSSRAVSRFVTLIQQIGREVREVQQVRGRFMDQLTDPELAQARQRLAEVLLAKGAQWQALEGEPWLVYAGGAHRRP